MNRDDYNTDTKIEDYPTYEQIGGDKEWNDMSELEQTYYNLMKCKNANIVLKNTIERRKQPKPSWTRKMRRM